MGPLGESSEMQPHVVGMHYLRLSAPIQNPASPLSSPAPKVLCQQLRDGLGEAAPPAALMRTVTEHRLLLSALMAGKLRHWGCCHLNLFSGALSGAGCRRRDGNPATIAPSTFITANVLLSQSRGKSG